jgi:hypothetical protein
MPDNVKTNWRELELGALWKKRDGEGKVKHLTGKITVDGNPVNVIVFPNTFQRQGW